MLTSAQIQSTTNSRTNDHDLQLRSDPGTAISKDSESGSEREDEVRQRLLKMILKKQAIRSQRSARV